MPPAIQARRRAAGAVADTVLFLFFFQLITLFVDAIYAFGLLGTDIPPEIVSVILFFAPLVLFIAPRLAQQLAFPLALAVIACRVGAVLLNTRGRLLVAGVGVAAAMLWLPLRLRREDDARPAGPGLALSLVTAVLGAVALRAAGLGLDPSIRSMAQWVGWLLAALAVAAIALDRGRDAGTPASGAAVSFGRLLVWVLGLNSALILLYFGFTSPSVIARWTGASYPAVVIALVSGFALFTAVVMCEHRLPRMGRSLLWALNGLFVLTLAAALLVHQLGFPDTPAGYPFYAPAVPWSAYLPLFSMLCLVPVVFVDVALYAREIAASGASVRALGGAFTLSALAWVVMIFAHVFTTVYDYIPVAGPWFRDRFWLVYTIAGLGMALPLLVVRKAPLQWGHAPVWASGNALLGVLTLVGVVVTQARPGPAPVQPTLTILTYNIQQGYRADGQRGVADQLALMRAVDADLIGLQESDTARISGGNADIIRYFADALDMYSYYGPTTVAGTFGIALLSKYPIENARTFYMYSEGEQTATIEAQVVVGGEAVNVFVTHLGNGGPIVQQESVLEVVQGKENVILVGDFNFRPETAQYALTTSILDDAWLRRWPEGVDDAGVAPDRRIDHVFVSPDMVVEDVRYLDSPVSDHPAVTAVLRP